jgi:hypothetical protein
VADDVTATPSRPGTRRGFGFGRATVAELYPPEVDPALPPRHKPGTPTDLYGDRPDQRKRRGAQPLPPRRERPPGLLASERGALLYGEPLAGLGQVQVDRLLEGETGDRLEATFAISSVIVQNTSAARTILVSAGEVDPARQNAVLVCPPGRLVSVPMGGERVIRYATADGVALGAGELVIITASDRQLGPASGAL